MTPSTTEIRVTAADDRIARMAAVAIALAVAEAAIPSPIPGVKPGLANIVVLIVLARDGLAAAAWVSLLRVLGASLLLGGFLTPGFLLALTGALTSLAALALAAHLPRVWFGPVSWSILAAFAHIAGQLAIAFWLLIPHPGLLSLAPLFGVAALVFGTVNGLVAAHFLAGNGGRAPQPPMYNRPG